MNEKKKKLHRARKKLRPVELKKRIAIRSGTATSSELELRCAQELLCKRFRFFWGFVQRVSITILHPPPTQALLTFCFAVLERAEAKN